jgi:hypothetical protein
MNDPNAFRCVTPIPSLPTPKVRTIEDVLNDARAIYNRGRVINRNRTYDKADKKAFVKLLFELRKLGGEVGALHTLGFTNGFYRWIEKYGTKAQKLEVFGTSAKPAWMIQTKAQMKNESRSTYAKKAARSSDGRFLPQVPYVAEPCSPTEVKPSIFRQLWNFISG